MCCDCENWDAGCVCSDELVGVGVRVSEGNVSEGGVCVLSAE